MRLELIDIENIIKELESKLPSLEKSLKDLKEAQKVRISTLLMEFTI